MIEKLQEFASNSGDKLGTTLGEVSKKMETIIAQVASAFGGIILAGIIIYIIVIVYNIVRKGSEAQERANNIRHLIIAIVCFIAVIILFSVALGFAIELGKSVTSDIGTQ